MSPKPLIKNIRRNKQEYSIQAVDNSIDVLEAFKKDQGELGVTELSQTVGLHKNNIFRLLATLQSRGYIEQNIKSGNYRLGSKILELGHAYTRHSGLINIAQNVLQDLTRDINENSYLGIMRNKQVIYVEHAQSHHVLQISSRLGVRISPLCTAIGRVIIAFVSADEQVNVIKENKFVKHTIRTIVDESELKKELKKVAKQGYAIDDEEFDIGITCIAAPVFDYEHNVVAGVSVSIPTARLIADNLTKYIIPEVVKAANLISKQIGYIEK